MTSAKCPICLTRKPKRSCPGRRDAICALCCGQERERTIRCPLHCEFLREARRHESLAELSPQTVPHSDMEITERFLQEHAMLGQFIGENLWMAVSRQAEAVDGDVREALAALSRTWRSLQSGLVYQSRPDNVYAAAIAEFLGDALRRLQASLAEQAGFGRLRDGEILGMLVFFERTAVQVNNQRPLGRSFIDVLRQNHEELQAMAGGPLPEEQMPQEQQAGPRILL